MSGPLDWPALASPQPLPGQLTFERGVWGKVHGASSDFRWIARSDGFGPGDGFERRIYLGSEDRPRRLSCWYTAEKGCFAIGGYPSRATDAAGRSGFLEKQILQWSRAPECPAALGALLLLPLAARLGDGIWWDRYPDRPWSQPDFSLPIAARDHAPAACSEADLAEVIARGLEILRRLLDEAVLGALYGQLLAGQRPAQLRGLEQPLPAEGLAVLLLPLPRALADELSLAGWIPSGRYGLEDLHSRGWDVLGLPQNPPFPAPPPALPEAVAERAGIMARALLAGDPTRLAETVPAKAVEMPSAAEPEPEAVVPPSPNLPLRPGRRLPLAEPGEFPAPILGEIYEFAAAVDRRWLDPARCPYPIGCLPPEGAGARALCDWVRQVAAARPVDADPAQWQVKVDLLRALALVLLPCPDTLDRVGLPESGRVPALLFGPRLESTDRDALAGLGDEALSRVLDHSVACPCWNTPLRAWLKAWQAATPHDHVRTLIGDALTRRGEV